MDFEYFHVSLTYLLKLNTNFKATHIRLSQSNIFPCPYITCTFICMYKTLFDLNVSKLLNGDSCKDRLLAALIILSCNK